MPRKPGVSRTRPDTTPAFGGSDVVTPPAGGPIMRLLTTASAHLVACLAALATAGTPAAAGPDELVDGANSATRVSQLSSDTDLRLKGAAE
jgi:hypothetical protein